MHTMPKEKRTGVRPAEHREGCRPRIVQSDLEPLDSNDIPGLHPLSVENPCYGRDFEPAPQAPEAYTRSKASYAKEEIKLAGNIPARRLVVTR